MASLSFVKHLLFECCADAAVGTVRATDLDAGRNARLSYALSVPSSMFYVNGETGELARAPCLAISICAIVGGRVAVRSVISSN